MKRLGAVLWFDDSSGEGIIYDLGTGKHLYVHYSAIQQNEWKKIEKDDFVEFAIYRNLYSSMVESCKVLEYDMDYDLVNTCLEMAFRRGVDILSYAPKYDKIPWFKLKKCMLCGMTAHSSMWRSHGIPLCWMHDVAARGAYGNKLFREEEKPEIRTHLRLLRKCSEKGVKIEKEKK